MKLICSFRNDLVRNRANLDKVSLLVKLDKLADIMQLQFDAKTKKLKLMSEKIYYFSRIIAFLVEEDVTESINSSNSKIIRYCFTNMNSIGENYEELADKTPYKSTIIFMNQAEYQADIYFIKSVRSKVLWNKIYVFLTQSKKREERKV
jgi:hypothetical protein